jgi:ABC-type amino acid transport substrate-binding protein
VSRQAVSQTFLFVLLVLSFLLSACAPKGIGPAPEGTLLRKIQDRGKLIVGIKTDIPTFGFKELRFNTIEGFDPAIGREIAARIFGDPSKVEFKPAVSKDRIPFLLDGTVDVILSTMTINDDRLKDIDFSVVYYVAGQRLLVRKDSHITSVADLADKKVGTAKGSTSATNLGKFSVGQVVLYDTYFDATTDLVQGKIDAVSTDDVILYGFALVNPDTNVVGAQFSYEPYGVGVPKNNPELLNEVNTVIHNLKTSGKWKQIWKKEIGDKVGILTIPDPPPDDWRK